MELKIVNGKFIRDDGWTANSFVQKEMEQIYENLKEWPLNQEIIINFN